MSSKATLRYALSGILNSLPGFPASGFSERSVSIDFDGEYAYTTVTVPTATTTQLLGDQGDDELELLIVVPTAAGNLTWASGTDADNCGVELRANFPFFLSRGSVATYAATTASANDTLADAQDFEKLSFRQASGSTAKVHVFSLYNT